MNAPRHILVSLRPRQWVKNAFVLAPVVFSGRASDPSELVRAAGAAICFILAAGAVYLVNDLVDRTADMAHPTKRLRPIAAGLVGTRTAITAAVVLMIAGLAFGALIDTTLAGILGGYIAMSLSYSAWLKHIVIIDVFVIAGGFVLRVLGGAAAVDVEPSIWLIICMGFLALMLAFGKRRGEVLLLEGGSVAHRAVLARYSAEFAGAMVLLTAGLALAAYAAYTATGRPAENHMAATLPFVVYGVFRYLWLVFQRGEGASPTEIAWTDRALAASVVLWGFTAALLLI